MNETLRDFFSLFALFFGAAVRHDRTGFTSQLQMAIALHRNNKY